MNEETLNYIEHGDKVRYIEALTSIQNLISRDLAKVVYLRKHKLNVQKRTQSLLQNMKRAGNLFTKEKFITRYDTNTSNPTLLHTIGVENDQFLIHHKPFIRPLPTDPKANYPPAGMKRIQS